MIEVCPEGYIDWIGSDITLNKRDIRSKFGYTTLNKISNSPFTVGKNKLNIFREGLASFKRETKKIKRESLTINWTVNDGG